MFRSELGIEPRNRLSPLRLVRYREGEITARPKQTTVVVVVVCGRNVRRMDGSGRTAVVIGIPEGTAGPAARETTRNNTHHAGFPAASVYNIRHAKKVYRKVYTFSCERLALPSALNLRKSQICVDDSK